MTEHADFVPRCPETVGDFRCDREEGHTGKHKSKLGTLTATWVRKTPARIDGNGSS